MIRLRRLLAVTALTTAVGGLTGLGVAHADPDDPEPAPPPPAGPQLSPEQQCAWIAFRTWVPCNWVMPAPPPPGTPGTLY
ncbi:hypothetical protein [Mycobacterium kubicae]|uniref:hypothetical protein n=1 Tax=Mycobacterium kubicae TaxID=120959 RepID=UPI000ABD1094|nr:hypothetical protein [Mycobacterium kubicae]